MYVYSSSYKYNHCLLPLLRSWLFSSINTIYVCEFDIDERRDEFPQNASHASLVPIQVIYNFLIDLRRTTVRFRITTNFKRTT